MTTLANTFLASASRFSTRLGPINSAVDKIVDRIAPKATAKACWSGQLCNKWCTYDVGCYYQGYHRVNIEYSPNHQCNYDKRSCSYCGNC